MQFSFQGIKGAEYNDNGTHHCPASSEKILTDPCRAGMHDPDWLAFVFYKQCFNAVLNKYTSRHFISPNTNNGWINGLSK